MGRCSVTEAADNTLPVLAILIPLFVAIVVASWGLGRKLSSMTTTFTEMVNALNIRVVKLEEARPAEEIKELKKDVERIGRNQDRMQWTCAAMHPKVDVPGGGVEG